MPKSRSQSGPAVAAVYNRRSRAWIPWIILVVAGAAVYANALRGPLVLDDQRSIEENASIRQMDSIASIFHPPVQSPVTGRPIVNLSFALNYAAGGLKVEGYHAANIAIHLLAGLVLFEVLRRTFARTRGFRLKPEATSADSPLALAGALIWLVHPLNTETVNYVTQRTEGLMALFYLFTLYAAIRAVEEMPRRRWMAIAGVAAYCAVGSKETALTLPLVIVLWDRVFAFSSVREAWARRWKLYVMVSASWLLFAIFAKELPFFAERGFEVQVSRWTYLLNQPLMIAQYLKLTIWPGSLVFDYGAPTAVSLGTVWPALVLTLSLLGATVIALVRWPALGFWGAWFFITLAPASSLIPIPTEVGAERRMYLPLIAVIALAALALDRLLAGARHASPPPVKIARPAVIAIGVVVIALGALTIRRNSEYQSGLRLWETSLDRWPQPRAREHLSLQLRDLGRTEEAIAQLATAAPESPTARHALASALLEQGNVAGAIGHFRQFVTDNPNSRNIIVAREEFAVALLRGGDPAGALEQFEQITQMAPTYARAHVGIADMRLQLKDVSGAIGAYRRALELQPDNVLALVNLGLLVAQSGDREEAMALLKRAISLEPRAMPPRKQIARLLLTAGRFEEMASEARVLTAMAPDDAESHNLLGVALASQGQFVPAGAAFEQVLRIEPNNPDARANLARLRAMVPPTQGRE